MGDFARKNAAAERNVRLITSRSKDPSRDPSLLRLSAPYATRQGAHASKNPLIIRSHA